MEVYHYEVCRIDKENKEQLKFIKNMVNDKVDLISENYDAYKPFLNAYVVSDPVLYQNSRSLLKSMGQSQIAENKYLSI